MKKEEFIEIIGENPEDIFGGDWENIILEWGYYEKLETRKS